METTKFEDYDAPPTEDGKYLWRMDCCDDEPDEIEIINGKPFKDSERQIMHGGQWKKI